MIEEFIKLSLELIKAVGVTGEAMGDTGGEPILEALVVVRLPWRCNRWRGLFTRIIYLTSKFLKSMGSPLDLIDTVLAPSSYEIVAF